jgi:hypothetical protein
VHGGTYYLDEPLIFTAADSGSADGSGGFCRRGRRDRGGQRRAAFATRLAALPRWDLPGRHAGRPGDRPTVRQWPNQPMARYPNFDPQVAIYNGYAADAFSRERAARWSDPVGGYIHAMHRAHWGGYHYRITGKTPDGSVVYEGGWQNNRQMGMHPEHRFVENIFEELDAPGEWYHDAANQSCTSIHRPN